ncbi:MAG: sialidase family protein [Limisphaerales bacterium]
MKSLATIATLLAALFAVVAADAPNLVRLGTPVGGHIHPAACVSAKGTLVVTFGQVNHRDLRLTRSTDGGATWAEPKPFAPTVGKSYYPGSLTTLRDGRLLHAWNRWSEPTNEKEPRSVLYSLSSDDGLTWSEPKPFPRDEQTPSIIRHPIVELAANQWLLPLSDKTQVFDPTSGASQPFGDGRAHGLVPIVRTPKGSFISGAGLRSTDAGKTWQPIAHFPNVKEQGWRHERVCLANGWLLASEILGPGVGGERIRYVLSRDDGVTWGETFEYYNPGRAIGGRACPRTVELGGGQLGVIFYDVELKQTGGPGVFFLKLTVEKLGRAAQPRGAN